MKSNSVFIIGAGASKEAKLPTGEELKSEISKLLDIKFELSNRLKSGDHLITSALRTYVRLPDGRNGNINLLMQEAVHISEALPLAISIDNFIDSHKENAEIALCGKLAIVRAILKAENESLLFFNNRQESTIDFNSLYGTWYLAFFQLLTENCDKEEIKNKLKSITLIIFNYDRCVEHYLYFSLMKYYKITADETLEILNCLHIYHPYGSVGKLPFYKSGITMGFGQEPNESQLLELAKSIKTFTEGTDPESSEIISIRNQMTIAQNLVFVGFAFHKLNMKLIAPEKIQPRTSRPECYATAFDISESDKLVIGGQINQLYGLGINTKMANKTCNDFFVEFWRSLSS